MNINLARMENVALGITLGLLTHKILGSLVPNHSLTISFNQKFTNILGSGLVAFMVFKYLEKK